MHLSSGEVLASDAIIYGSGWKPQPSIEFLPTDLAKRLGLPHQSSQKNELVLAADRDILGRFPRLKDQPTINPKSKPLSGDPAKQERITEPFRLYRLMAPPDPDLMKLHNIGFAGMILVLSTYLLPCYVRFLWRNCQTGTLSALCACPQALKACFGYCYKHSDGAGVSAEEQARASTLVPSCAYAFS